MELFRSLGYPAFRDVSRFPAGVWSLLEGWEATTGAHARALADLQVRVIHLEAECGLLALGDRVFRWRREHRQLEELSDAAVSAHCPGGLRGKT